MNAPTFQRIGRQRLHPVDLYHMIDWVRDEWAQPEWDHARKMQRLKWHLLEMPDRFHERALAEYATILRARMVVGAPWEQAIADLRRIVSEWHREIKAAA